MRKERRDVCVCACISPLLSSSTVDLGVVKLRRTKRIFIRSFIDRHRSNMNLIAVSLLLLLTQSQPIGSATLKDPFEYFRKLTRDLDVYAQCDLIPPHQLQLDSSFFDPDLRRWDRKKFPPPPHRTLEAFVQLDTLRQSSFFSQVLQGKSQSQVPGKRPIAVRRRFAPADVRFSSFRDSLLLSVRRCSTPLASAIESFPEQTVRHGSDRSLRF